MRISPDVIAAAYRAGLLCREIAERYRISESTVRRHLKREGVPVRKRTAAERLKQATDCIKRSPDESILCVKLSSASEKRENPLTHSLTI